METAEQFVTGYKRQVPEKDKDQYEILMKLAPGSTLSNFNLSNREMPTVRWLDLSIAFVKSIVALHKKNMLHGDIHGQNFMLHLASQTVTPVDFGKARFLPPGQAQRSETFAILVKALELLGLGNMQSNGFVMHSLDDAHASGRIKSKKTREQLLVNLSELVEEPEICRYVSSEDLLDVLIEIRAKLEAADCKINVGYLNLQEYINADDNERSLMLTALKDKDEVFLVDVNQRPLKEYIEMQQVFEKAGLVVMSDVIQSGARPIAEVIDQHIQQRKQDDTQGYIYECSSVGIANTTVPSAVHETKASQAGFYKVLKTDPNKTADPHAVTQDASEPPSLD